MKLKFYSWFTLVTICLFDALMISAYAYVLMTHPWLGWALTSILKGVFHA